MHNNFYFNFKFCSYIAPSEHKTSHSPGVLSDSETGETAAKSKPLLLKDYERQILLTMQGFILVISTIY